MLSENIKKLREKFSYSQAFVAEYLELTPAAVNQYENDARAIPEKVVSKLALLYNVEEYDLYEEHPENKELLTSFAFRAEDLSAEDMRAISKFKTIVSNYIDMSTALKDE
jgi:transcriptional regulator with XRE-family HTH domain